MREHAINKLDNFISGWYIPEEYCDQVVEFFNTHKDLQRPGALTYDTDNPSVTDESCKKSTDMYIVDYIQAPKYIDALESCYNEYIKKYKYSVEKQAPYSLGPFNIQRYLPEEGYYIWHYERADALSTGDRVLTFITYLNDVTDAGETEFYYQDTKIKAEKGLTLIFPTDWMFTHRGVPSKTETKYITTGWFQYEQSRENSPLTF